MKGIDQPKITLRVGDCLEVLKQYPDGHFDVCVTSPPYNLGKDYASGIDDNRSDYLGWCSRWLHRLSRKLSKRGSLFLNIAGSPSKPLGPYNVLREALAAGWVLQNTIYWVKSIAMGDVPCKGHVKPVNSTRFLNDAVEHVFHLTKTGDVPLDKLAIGVPFADKGNLERGGRGKHGDVRDRGNAWFIPYKTIVSRDRDRPHPATFPVALAAMCLKLHGVSRITRTLDPFSGLGSTARASKQLGLAHVGIELSKEYVAEAFQLLEE